MTQFPQYKMLFLKSDLITELLTNWEIAFLNVIRGWEQAARQLNIIGVYECLDATHNALRKIRRTQAFSDPYFSAKRTKSKILYLYFRRSRPEVFCKKRGS